MEKVAFIIGGTCIYWSSIVMTLAAAAGVCTFASLYIKKTKNYVAASIAVPLAMLFSAVLGRIVHWYSRTDSYASFMDAVTDYSWGGYALIGVFFGCLLAAGLLRLCKISRNLPVMLDCASLGVGLAIAIGRLTFFFNASDRGLVVPNSWGFPLAFPVSNPVSGVVENRLATFLLQGIYTGIITLILLWRYTRKGKKWKMRPGDLCLLFLTWHCASQVFFDSTRYDSLFLRSNGFVSIVQILSAVGLVGSMVYFTVLAAKNGKGTACIVIWVLFLAAMGGAGYMEYYVQRHGDAAAFAYSVMISCLTLLAILGTIMRKLSLKKKN